MAFVDQFNRGMQRVMAMRTPEILALLPRVEAMEWDDRVAMVRRGQENLAAVLRSWDKFASILVAQGNDRAEVKRRRKALISAKTHLENAMRLNDPRNPPAFRDQARSAFDVLAACFLRDAGILEEVLTGPRITPTTMPSLTLPVFDRELVETVGIVDAVSDGPTDVRTAPESDPVDLAIEAVRVQ